MFGQSIVCFERERYTTVTASYVSSFFHLTKEEFIKKYFLSFENSVDSWAEIFGKELYEMAQTMTKVNEIKDVSEFYTAKILCFARK